MVAASFTGKLLAEWQHITALVYTVCAAACRSLSNQHTNAEKHLICFFWQDHKHAFSQFHMQSEAD